VLSEDDEEKTRKYMNSKNDLISDFGSMLKSPVATLKKEIQIKPSKIKLNLSQIDFNGSQD